MMHVNGIVQSIVCAQKIIVGILPHVFVRSWDGMVQIVYPQM